MCAVLEAERWWGPPVAGGRGMGIDHRGSAFTCEVDEF